MAKKGVPRQQESEMCVIKAKRHYVASCAPEFARDVPVAGEIMFGLKV